MKKDDAYNKKNDIVATLRQVDMSEEQVKENFYKLLEGIK